MTNMHELYETSMPKIRKMFTTNQSPYTAISILVAHKFQILHKNRHFPLNLTYSKLRKITMAKSKLELKDLGSKRY